MNPANAEALAWQVNGLSLAGLSWGKTTDRPVLALHGWLDNAASYAFLAPHMAGCRVVAPDLTGHGLSDHRSADASYHIYDDLPELLGILDALGWREFHLMGHSRGAIIAMLLASTHPERVLSLSLMDGLIPPPMADAEFPAQLRKALDDKQTLLGKESRALAGEEAAIAVRLRRGMSREAAVQIVRRNVLQAPDGTLRWRTDPRLQGASAMKLTLAQCEAALQALEMPTQVLFATDTAYRAPGLEELVATHVRNATVEQVVGHHHFHMEPGCDEVAGRLVRFMAQAGEME